MSELLLTAAQMRALEQAAIASGEVTGLELMERAGQGAVEAILAEWPELAKGARRAVVLCGPGNNGGDGFVVARLLRERGWEVECLVYGDPDALPPDAKANFERWEQAESAADDEAWGPFGYSYIHQWMSYPYDLYVDALFGTGLSRPLSDDLVSALRTAQAMGGMERARRVALDVPSGLCADSGRLLPGNVDNSVDLTISFATAKVGHFLASGPLACGKVVVVDIGLDTGHRSLSSLPSGSSCGPQFVGAVGLPRMVERPRHGLAKGRSGSAHHKFDHGHALVLAGGVGRGGAARLAARAALRIGAGLVTVAPPPAALIENASRMDAIMLRAVRDADALRALLEDDRLNALCLGPGLGTGEREAALVATALAADRATVLDGDALTLIAKGDTLRDALHDRCVLTPHMGEFARLAPHLSERLNAPAEAGPAYSRLDAARDLAAHTGATVLLKGPDTVIAAPSGQAAIHAAAYGREVPWLATAGAGDVLAGIIAGLLARGLDPMAACKAAVWLHVEAARAFGPGLIAEDLPEMLPRVLRDLES